MIAKLRTAVTAAVLLGTAAAGHVAQAAYIPYGVQNDVSLSTVENTWGWTLISSSNYGGGLSISDLFAGHGTEVIVGAMHAGSDTIDVLAAGSYATVTTYTPLNATNSENGVEWYFNDYSMGFAEDGATICQGSADVCGPSDRSRLSWHTSSNIDFWNQNPNIPPAYVFDGWRSGDNTGIYTGTDWTRVVFTISEVPAPGALALLGLGLIGLSAMRRRSPV